MGNELLDLFGAINEANSGAVATWRRAVSLALDTTGVIPIPPIPTDAFLIVQSLADLPAPVGGVITLLPNTCYFIHGIVDIGANELRLNTQTIVRGLCGNPHDALVKSVGTGPLLSLADPTVTNTSIRQIVLANFAGRAIQFAGNGTNTMSLIEIVFINCTAAGLVSSFFQFSINSMVFTNCSDGLTLGGTNTQLAISDMAATFNKPGFRFITALAGTVVNTIAISRLIQLAISPTEIGLNITAANLSTVNGIVSTCSLTGPPGFVAVVDPTLKTLPVWSFSNSIGFSNSQYVGAMAYRTAVAITQTGSGAAAVEVLDTGTPFALDPGVERFTIINPSANVKRLKYIGLRAATVNIMAIIGAQNAGGASNVVQLSVAINGIQQAQSKIDIQVSNVQSNLLVTAFQATLQPNDAVSMMVQDITGVQNVELYSARLNIVGAATGL